MPDREPLHIYLRDHFAGATAGLDLARRMARNAPGEPLSEIAAQIELDRRTLREVMSALELTPAPLKTAIGWTAEKATRLRLKDRAFGRASPRDVLELETLIAGVSGKLQLWRGLAELASVDKRLREFDFAGLGGRAEEQRRRLEELHELAVRDSLGPDRGPG